MFPGTPEWDHQVLQKQVKETHAVAKSGTEAKVVTLESIQNKFPKTIKISYTILVFLPLISKIYRDALTPFSKVKASSHSLIHKGTF